MIVLMITALGLAAGSGALLDTDAYWGDPVLEDIHEAAGAAFFLLVPLHLLGVVVSSLLHRENLVKAMITGSKPTD